MDRGDVHLCQKKWKEAKTASQKKRFLLSKLLDKEVGWLYG